MKRILLVLFCMGFLLFHNSNIWAAPITSTFDSNAEGWTVPSADGTLTWLSDGSGGGYLVTEDIRTEHLIASAPSAFTGDLSEFNNGILSFDSILLQMSILPNNESLVRFGEVTIESTSSSVTLDIVPNPLPTEWMTYSVSLSSTAWGLNQAQWESILSNVTQVSVVVDSYNNLHDKVGFDNFTISGTHAVPEPATIFLLGFGLIGLAGFRRKFRK